MKYAQELESRLIKIADPKASLDMQAYMKNHFRFLGVKASSRKEVLREHTKECRLPDDANFEQTIKTLWNQPYRELHYCAQELVDRKKWWKEASSIELIEWMITHESWWDTVDFIASTLCGNHFKTHPGNLERVRIWNRSKDIWLIRSSLLFQLKYKNDTDLELLEELIVPHLNQREFFIQKAIGWALRDYAWHDPAEIQRYVTANRAKLSPLSQREALKNKGKRRSHNDRPRKRRLDSRTRSPTRSDS